MTLPRLVGLRTVLVPATHDVATAVVAGDLAQLADTLAGLDLVMGAGWPQTETMEALRPQAEYGSPAQEIGVWLLTVDGMVVGELGWLGGPTEEGECELSYGVAAPSRNHGLASEAVGLLADWAAAQPGVQQVTAEALQGNEPSRRLLRRLGFTEGPALARYVRYHRSTTTGPLQPEPHQPEPHHPSAPTVVA